jgi:hypothetical protein
MTPSAFAAAFSLLAFAVSAVAVPVIKSIEFIGMPALVTADEKTDVYSKAQMKVAYWNGRSQIYDLSYHELMGTTDALNGRIVGGLYDDHGHPLTDAEGQIASDSPDGNSLMMIPGMKAADPVRNEASALVTQYEYKELPPAGQTGRFWSKLPATASLAKLDQNKSTDALEVVDYRNIGFGSVNGLWIACAASLSPWNTHLGSEEYESAGRKAYVAISRIEKGMADGAGDIRLAQNDGGAIYELTLTDGHEAGIDSRFVASTMKSVPALLGGWLGKDGNGQDEKDTEDNRCEQDKVCGPDNLKFSPASRALFIGEDTNRRNNNYVWAYNVDNRRLTRILSTPMGAEAAGLQIVENAHGFSYIMSNFQHTGEDVNKNYTGHDKDLVIAKPNEKWHTLHRAAIGYIGTSQGAMPAIARIYRGITRS